MKGGMEMDERDDVMFEEVLNSEFDDIWDIFFPYMAEKKEALQRLDEDDDSKPRRHLRFIAM